MKYEKSCGCVVFDEGKVLMIQHNEGHWDFPKGHVEGNETEIQTAIREVKEETNIDVNVKSQNRYTIEYSPKDGVLKEVVYFIATKNSNECKPQESEVQKVEWVRIEDAIDRVTFDITRNVLKRAIGDIEKNGMEI